MPVVRNALRVVSAFVVVLALAQTAAAQQPKLNAFVLLPDVDGYWTNSQNFGGNCGLVRGFVVAGSNPQGPILNPVGGWGDLLSIPLADGTYTYTILGDGFHWEWTPSRLILYFDIFGNTPFQVSSLAGGPRPQGWDPDTPGWSLTAGLTTITVTNFTLQRPSFDRISWCSTNSDGVWDTVAQVTFTVTTATPPDGPPTAVAGGPYSVVEHQSVSLDGSASFDDNTPSASLGYAWSVTASPAGSNGGALTSANTAAPSFTPDVPGSYTLTLVVTDSIGQTGSATATVSSNDLPPIANAGPSIGTYTGAVVSLDGSLSYDPNGDAINFAWSLVAPAGSSASLTNAASASPSFVPDVAGQYTAMLTVTDQWGMAGTSSSQISVATPGDYAQGQSTDAINTVTTLPPVAVTTAGNQQSLGNFLTQTVSALQKNNTAQAIQKLQQAISRTDGCILRGSPDKNGPGMDWVTDCAAQQQLYNQLVAALNAIQQ
jgi:hypothetical protein